MRDVSNNNKARAIGQGLLLKLLRVGTTADNCYLRHQVGHPAMQFSASELSSGNLATVVNSTVA